MTINKIKVKETAEVDLYQFEGSLEEPAQGHSTGAPDAL